MLDLFFVLVFLAGLAWVAARAFMRPHGVYRKSLLGFFGAVTSAAAVWFCAGPLISNEAGLGAPVVFLMVVAAAGLATVVAFASATVRYAIDALT